MSLPKFRMDSTILSVYIYIWKNYVYVALKVNVIVYDNMLYYIYNFIIILLTYINNNHWILI